MNSEVLRKAIGRDLRWALADDAQIKPLSDFPPAVRNRIGSSAGGFVLYRPRSRSHPKAVDAMLGRALQRFKHPAAFLEVVCQCADSERVDPFAVLRRLKPIVRRLISAGILVRAGRAQRKIAPSLKAGSSFGPYKVLSCVSTTIDSEVYCVEDKGGRRWALKSARPGVSRVEEQLQAEFDCLRRLAGTAACGIQESGKKNGRVYAILEWIEGPDIIRQANLLRKLSPTPAAARRQLLQLACSFLDALAGIHRRGWLHGDIHPKNFIVQGGRVRIVDLGMARRGDGVSSGLSGVFQYMPPEAASALLAGAGRFTRSRRSEIYCAGVVAYQVLAGRHYLPTSVLKAEAAKLIASASPKRLKWLDAQRVLLKALAKRPAARFASLAAFASAMAGIDMPASGRAGSSPPAPLTPELGRFQRDYLEELRSLSYRTLEATQHPPFATLASGGAGVAYALLKAAQRFDDAELLALSANWIGQCVSALRDPRALYDARGEFTAELVRRCSLPFSDLGVRFVQALIARACDSATMEEDAFAGIEASFDRRRDSEPFDLFLGPPGLLTALSILHADKPDARLRRWAAAVAKPLLADPPAAGLKTLGLSHGTAGLCFSLVQWAMVFGEKPPAWLSGELRKLVESAVPVGSALDWPVRRSNPREFMNSLCNGAPGIAITFARAYELYGDPIYLAGARTAGRRAMKGTAQFSSLCCGAVGRAYGLLAVARIDGSGPWREAAVRCAVQSLKNKLDTRAPHGLLKGQTGNLCLTIDLLQGAAQPPGCPMLEVA